MSTVTYRGYGAEERGGARLVSRIEDGQEEPLRHYARHSPSGYSWGYGGSGPADLARSILLDAIGDARRCPTCGGGGQITEDGESVTCWDCDGTGLLDGLPYHRFKFEVVARWPQDEGWAIDREQVLAWLADTGAVIT